MSNKEENFFSNSFGKEEKGDIPRILREEAGAYGIAKQEGDFTLEDYYAWPEEERIELIDGVIFTMEAPNIYHQGVVGEIYHQLRNFFDGKTGSCRPFVSPVDVKLGTDNKTMVQPDVVILCDPQKLRPWGIEGAPDFVLEVLSVSTRKKDSTIKFRKYLDTGVREYWIIDPENRRVIMYLFEEGGVTRILPLKGKQALALFDGKCLLDFDKIAACLEII